MSLIQFILFSTLITSSAYARDLILNASVADANVFEISRSEGVEKEVLLGKTPFTLKDHDSQTDHLYKIEKPGFSPVYIPFLRSVSSDASVKVILRSHSDWIPEDAAKRASELAEKQVEDILTVQLLLDQKKLAEALVKAEDLKRNYPASIGAQLVYANALLMNGQHARASTLYAALAQELPETKASLKSSLLNLVSKLNRGRK